MTWLLLLLGFGALAWFTIVIRVDRARQRRFESDLAQIRWAFSQAADEAEVLDVTLAQLGSSLAAAVQAANSAAPGELLQPRASEAGKPAHQVVNALDVLPWLQGYNIVDTWQISRRALAARWAPELVAVSEPAHYRDFGFVVRFADIDSAFKYLRVTTTKHAFGWSGSYATSWIYEVRNRASYWKEKSTSVGQKRPARQSA